MNQRRFDTWSRALVTETHSRRGALRLASLSALASLLAGIALPGRAAAAASCRKVDQPCRRASQCCSNICRRRRGKKKCRGHGAGTCKQQGQRLVCTAQDIELSRCNNDQNCGCVRTTAGTNFCGDFFFPSGCTTCSDCAVCKRDADCERKGFPRGSACVPFSEGRCAGVCQSGTRCMVRCGTVPRN